MKNRLLPPAAPAQYLEFGILALLLVALCVAGGGARGDILGQVPVRIAALAAVAACALFGAQARWATIRFPLILIGLTMALPALQLVPLSPSFWHALPGREVFSEAVGAAGSGDIWRPLALYPDGALNALVSLLIPLSVMIVWAFVGIAHRPLILPLLVVLILTSALIGLLQLSSGLGGSPFLNDNRGDISGLFSNRNHQALFLAIGMLLTMGWAFRDDARPIWRIWAAGAIIPFLALMVLATGSRAGLGLAALALGAGLLIGFRGLRAFLKRLPRPLAIALPILILALAAGLIVISISADRALSLTRATDTNVGAELRTETLPIVLNMVRDMAIYGSGFGSFDPLFRSYEPVSMLNPHYFNHAHDDFLEVLIEGGVPAAILLALALGWWLWRSGTIWLRPRVEGTTLAKLGSVVILLAALASIVDYPVRTPVMMAIVALAACWMEGVSPRARAAFTTK